MKTKALNFSIYLYTILLLGIFLNSCKNCKKDFDNTTNNTFDNSFITDGYTNKLSYFPGDTCKIYINSVITDYVNLNIYDLSGNVVDVVYTKVFKQSIQNLPWENGYGYRVTSTYAVPDLEPGIYLIANKIPFIVKSKKNKLITCVVPTNTFNAYNNAGGKCLYTSRSSDHVKANKVSFLRPMNFKDEYFSYEFANWLQTTFVGIVNFIADIDLDSLQFFENSKVLIISGHSEYWTRKARENFDEFVESGKHAVVLSGNTMWWQVRYDEKLQTLICYKNYDNDPVQDPLLKTTQWNDIRLKYPVIQSIAADFQNGGYGLKTDDGWDGYKIILPNSPLLKNTGLNFGDILPLPTHEYDGVPIIGFSGNIPIPDTTVLKLNKIEIIGYDFGFRINKTVGTFFCFKKTPASGYIVHTGSTNWCTKQNFTGKNKKLFTTITKNMISLLLNDQNIFTIN